MASVRKVSTLALCLASAPWLLAQQTATPQSALASALSGLGAANIQSSSLSGNAELIAGATDATGSFTASCAVNGSSQLQLQLSSASSTETRQITSGVPTGNWVDSQGVQHTMAGQNLYTPESWFCPQIALARFLQNSGLTIQSLGNVSKNGATAAHYAITAASPGTTALSALTAHLSNADLYLDPATQRPVALDFNIHPDSDATIDIPVEIRFSNYTNANGVWVPFTVERYVNSTLTLTLQVASASSTPAGSANQ
jgi:hypothetical protein